MAQPDSTAPHINPLLAAALDYAARGWPVFPLVPGGKKPVIPKPKGGNGGWHMATTDAAQIRAWWQRWPRANIGMPTGAPSGVIVIDEDPRNGGDAAPLLLPPTLAATTPSGGRHFYYRYPADGKRIPKDNGGKLARGVDGLADGAYVVLAPSLLSDRTRYRWQDESQPLADCPGRIVTILRASPLRNDASEGANSGVRQPGGTGRRDNDTGDHWLGKALARCSVGARNATGFWLACQLRDAGLGEFEAAQTMRAYAARVPDPQSYSDREALSSLRTAYAQTAREEAKGPGGGTFAKPPQKITKPITPSPAQGEPGETAPDDASGHRTDLGNARRFVKRHGENVRHIAAWGHWLIWDGTRWRKDATDEVMRLAKETVASIYQEAIDATDSDERRDLFKWAMRSEAEARLRAMLAVAESEPGVALAPDELDAHHWLLNCRNGLVDLHTGHLLPHDRTYLCTKRAEVDYDEDAFCPSWEAFLARVFADDTDLIAYVQRAIGYTLTCETSEQCVFVLHGTGANGKSTLIDTLCRLLGDYGMTTPTDTLMVKQGQTIPSDVARLMGARLVAASEAGDGRRMDEELIKRISGGDRMAARFMHKDWFEFYPVFKLFLAVNHKPTIRGTDNGIWRRIRLIPFTVTIPDDQQDSDLPRKLASEAPGILAWAVRGCIAWQRQRLKTPASVAAATQSYRDEMDTIGRFISDCCVEQSNAQVSAKALYQAYEDWCNEQGEHQMSQTRFGLSLGERGFQKVKTPYVVWRGVGLASKPTQGHLPETRI